MLTIDKNTIESSFNNKNILITGGTGTFGNEMTSKLLNNFNCNKIIIFSRDEYKQFIMKKKYENHPKFNKLRFFLGDIRDYQRLVQAFKNINIIFHAAALKQVLALEYNPEEAIKTNIIGTQNVVNAALINNVDKIIAISTDKCVQPNNIYGASKLCLERLMISKNINSTPKLSVLRYGNVINSRGSVVPLFKKLQKENKEITITDKQMTRFTMNISEAINFTLNCCHISKGSEIFIPKIPSYRIGQLQEIIAPNSKIKIIGKMTGEKIYETLISNNEINNTIDCGNYYVIIPNWCNVDNRIQELKTFYGSKKIYKPYNSKDNIFLSNEELKKYIYEII